MRRHTDMHTPDWDFQQLSDAHDLVGQSEIGYHARRISEGDYALNRYGHLDRAAYGVGYRSCFGLRPVICRVIVV